METTRGRKILAEHCYESREAFEVAISEALRPREVGEPAEPMPIILYRSEDVTIESVVRLVNRRGGVAEVVETATDDVTTKPATRLVVDQRDAVEIVDTAIRVAGRYAI